MTRIICSRTALTHNATLIRDRVAPAELMAVVKDDAYGHGLGEVVRALRESGIARFGVLDLDGAARVREWAPDASVFAWVIDDGDDLDTAIRSGIELGVSDRRTLERVARTAEEGGGGAARIHIKVDSGLHRAGILPSDWARFVARVAELAHRRSIRLEGIWTHIAEASEESDSAAIALFEQAVTTTAGAGLRPRLRHLAASAAAYSRHDARFDLVRVGAFLYGIAPGSGVGPAELGLRPVMTAAGRIVAVDGSTGTARIDVGGVDGLLRDTVGAVSVTIRGVRHPLTALSALHSDVRMNGRIETGDEVLLFGPGTAGEQTITEWADAMGTIGEELAIRVSRGQPREWTDS